MKYLFDTNAVINFVCGKGDFSFLTSDDKIFISFITSIELSVGLRNAEEEEVVLKFKNMTELVLIESEIINMTIDMRKKFGLKIPDSIIAATAIIYDAILVTSDKDLIVRLNKSGIKVINPC
jgi:predicted nucleic acid-binding protein